MEAGASHGARRAYGHPRRRIPAGRRLQCRATLLPARAHRERLRDRPEDAAATSSSVSRTREAPSARCQCLNDEQLRAVLRSRRSERVETGGSAPGCGPHEEEDAPWPRYEALRCRECGRSYEIAPIYTCEWCFGPLEVAYDYDAISASISRETIAAGPPTIWRYADLLPVDAPSGDATSGGWTPLVRADHLAAELGLDELWIKNDTRNPTNSFKDRVVAVALAKAREFGFKTLACASTGNLANAVAAHAARAGLRSYVFIPSDLEAGKIVTTSVYGGNVVAVDGNYDDVNRLCAELASASTRGRSSNINMRPFYAEGSKTLAFEIAEQLGWQAPDHVVVPVGSGSLLTKIRKGFEELCKVGLLDDAPTCACRARRPRAARRSPTRSPRAPTSSRP